MDEMSYRFVNFDRQVVKLCFVCCVCSFIFLAQKMERMSFRFVNADRSVVRLAISHPTFEVVKKKVGNIY
jgi:hypothetical protein